MKNKDSALVWEKIIRIDGIYLRIVEEQRNI